MYAMLSSTHGEDFHFLQATRVSCSPSSVFTESPCGKMLRYELDMTRSKPLDAIILTSAWWDIDYGALKALIMVLKAQGRKIILIGPPVQYSTDVYKIIARWDNQMVFRQYLDAHMQHGYVTLAKEMRAFAQAQNINYIDRMYYYCKDGCPVIGPDGELLITDYGHLTAAGASYLGNQLLSDRVLDRIMHSPLPLQFPEGATSGR